MTTSDPQLDTLLVDPTRLSIVSLLVHCHWAEFSFVRDSAKVSASALSKQVSTLEKQGYVEVKKGYVGKRPRTWLNLTSEGAKALRRHVRALEQIVQQAAAATADKAEE